jgi:hypothetical protein
MWVWERKLSQKLLENGCTNIISQLENDTYVKGRKISDVTNWPIVMTKICLRLSGFGKVLVFIIRALLLCYDMVFFFFFFEDYDMFVYLQLCLLVLFFDLSQSGSTMRN